MGEEWVDGEGVVHKGSEVATVQSCTDSSGSENLHMNPVAGGGGKVVALWTLPADTSVEVPVDAHHVEGSCQQDPATAKVADLRGHASIGLSHAVVPCVCCIQSYFRDFVKDHSISGHEIQSSRRETKNQLLLIRD